MTDLPPRTTPRADDRRVTPTRYSQASMWLVFLVLAAVILAAIAFSVNRSPSVVDTTTTTPAPTEPAATTTTAPAETAPADAGSGTDAGTDGSAGTGTTPAPAPGSSGTTQPAP